MKNLLHQTLYFTILSMFMMSCSSSEVPAAEDPIDSGGSGEVTVVTYDADVSSIIANNCSTSGCHASTNPAAGLALTNYTQVKEAAENGNLIARMNSTTAPMPQSGRLSASVLAIIDQWKEDGFLEN